MKNKVKLLYIFIFIILISLTILFIYEKNKTTITFYSNNGTEIKEIKAKKGQTITLPKPEKKDYTFKGWFNNKSLSGKKITKLKVENEKQIKLYAKWEKILKKFTVSFDCDGTILTEITLTEGDKLQLPTAPQKEEYNFISWINNDGLEIENNTILKPKNITLYAKYEEKKYEYYCENGYTLNETKCTKTLTLSPKIIETCPDGYISAGKDMCFELIINQELICPEGTTRYDSFHSCLGEIVDLVDPYCGYAGHTWVNNVCYDKVPIKCKAGGVLCNGTNEKDMKCYCTGGQIKSSTKTVVCDDNFKLENGKCIQQIIKDAQKKEVN